MYQAYHGRFDRLLDLGWYPEADFENGEFKLVLYAGDFSGELLKEFRSKCRQTIIEKINEWIQAVSDGKT